jgi:RNA-directed DNA polymerase
MNYSVDRVVRNLAAALLAGDWTVDGLAERAAEAFGGRFRFIRPLVRRVLATFPTPPTADALFAFASADAPLGRAMRCGSARVARLFVVPPVMAPLPAAAGWTVPPLTTTQAVADYFGLAPGRLLWLADLGGRNGRDRSPRLRNYHYAWIPKPGGRRLLEAPKHELKRVQRRILADILGPVPAHPAAHGFCPGRSILTNAVPHCGKAVVLRFDLSDFFASVPAARVFAVFRSLGYPPEVARVLTGLCTTRLPPEVWDARPDPRRDGCEHPAGAKFAEAHLPQGAPTSPALANLCAYRLDCRLAGLAEAVGATYTRYADDLTFSGDDALRRGNIRMLRAVAGIAAGEGFSLNARKTKVLGRGVRQTVAGVVVNARPNVRRADFDDLKAVLTNCVRHGPAGQNRDGHADWRGHLAGRVAHVGMLHPARGAKLRALLERIDWG